MQLFIAVALSVLLAMVTVSSRLNLNFLKIHSLLNVSIKWMGSAPKNLVPSWHSCCPKTYETEQPLLSSVLGCLNVGELMNNFERL